MTSMLRYSALVSFIFISASITTTMADDVEKPAHAAYPKPFSRPNSMGEDYDTWRDATGPDIGETPVDISRLPSRVDNSTRPQFPQYTNRKEEPVVSSRRLPRFLPTK